MAVRLLVAGTAALSLVVAAPATSLSAHADQGRIAFATDRAPNLRRLAFFSVRENGSGKRFRLWPRGVPEGLFTPDRKRILFVKHEAGDTGLFIASGTGANARRLTPPDVVPTPSFGLTFSPDGHEIAFSGYRRCTRCPVAGIFIVRLDGTGLRQVAVDAREPAWAPNGRRLAYSGDMNRGPIRSVYVVGLDGKRPRRLGRGAHPVWAPDGNRVAYIAVGQSEPQSAFCVVSVRRPRRHCFNGPRPWGVSWSPTGRHIALMGSRAVRARGRLAIVGADGRDLHVLARNLHGGAAWSSDGKRIAYLALTPGDQRILMRGALRPGPARLLAAESPLAGIGCCSFRRGRVEYSLFLHDNDDEVAVVSADGSGFRALTKNFVDDQTPAWSPDGMTIAFSRVLMDYSGSEPVSGGTVLRLIDADGTDDRQLTRSGAWRDTNPTWSPDGRRVAFVRAPVNEREGTLMIVDLADGSVRPLVGPYVEVNGISWSPGGELIVFTDRPCGSYSLAFVHPDGTGYHCTFVGRALASPRWSPDGSRLAFWATGQLFTVQLDGSDVRNVADTALSGATWSRDGMRLAFARRRSAQPPLESDIWTASSSGGAEVKVTDDPSLNLAPDWGP